MGVHTLISIKLSIFITKIHLQIPSLPVKKASIMPTYQWTFVRKWFLWSACEPIYNMSYKTCTRFYFLFVGVVIHFTKHSKASREEKSLGHTAYYTESLFTKWMFPGLRNLRDGNILTAYTFSMILTMKTRWILSFVESTFWPIPVSRNSTECNAIFLPSNKFQLTDVVIEKQ